MDEEYVYVPPGDTWLVERWIAERRRGSDGVASVRLVAEAGSLAQAESLAEGFGGPRPTLLGNFSGSRIVLPLSLPQTLLQFRPPHEMPDVAEIYPLIRRFWLAGARAFELYSLGGSRLLRVPMLLDALVDAHKGKQCFVAGNGPSLNDIDMGALRGEIVLGSNQVYLGYETWGFSFPYWGVYDDYQIQTYGRDYEERVPQACTQFFPFPYLPLLDFVNGCAVNTVFPKEARAFSDTPERVFRGFTVTYMLLQIAAIMGCDPIILIGVDHRYNLQRRYIASKTLRSVRRALVRRMRGGRVYDAAFAAAQAWKRQGGARPGEVKLWEADHAAGPTHFTAAYTQSGKRRFLPPEPEEAERDFACAAAWAKANGRSILNATPGSALTAFPRVAFGEAIKGSGR